MLHHLEDPPRQPTPPAPPPASPAKTQLLGPLPICLALAASSSGEPAPWTPAWHPAPPDLLPRARSRRRRHECGSFSAATNQGCGGNCRSAGCRRSGGVWSSTWCWSSPNRLPVLDLIPNPVAVALSEHDDDGCHHTDVRFLDLLTCFGIVVSSASLCSFCSSSAHCPGWSTCCAPCRTTSEGRGIQGPAVGSRGDNGSYQR